MSRIKEPKMPLKFYEDRDAFKLFLLDCGLLACMTDASAGQMLIGDNAFTEFKGALSPIRSEEHTSELQSLQ